MSMVVRSGRAREPQASAAPPLEVVIFTVEGETFGVDIHRVAEISRRLEITRVPRSLSFIEGIVNLRGRIIPVVDLRKRLGIGGTTAAGRDRRMVIVRLERQRLGLLVDSVKRVAGIPRETIQRVPPATMQIDADLIGGIGHLDDSLVILLAIDKLLTPGEQSLLAGQSRSLQPASTETEPR